MTYFPKGVKPSNKWATLAAWLFGKRIEGRDGNVTLVCYLWRGNLYATEFRGEEAKTE